MGNGLIKDFIEAFVRRRDVDEAYKLTLELAEIFYTERETDEFIDFYKKYGEVFKYGITTAV